MEQGIIYQGHGYTASIAGFKALNGPFLCITRKAGGKYLSGAEAISWAEHIRTALDSREAAALCRAIFQA